MENNSVKKFLLNGNTVRGMALCGPDTFVLCSIGCKTYYELLDFTCTKKKSYDSNEFIVQTIMPRNNLEIMFVDCGGSCIKTFNIETGEISNMFNLQGITLQELLSCSIVKKGLMQFTYKKAESCYKIILFNYEHNKTEKEFTVTLSLLAQAIGCDRYMFWLTADLELFELDTDTNEYASTIKIPPRQSSPHKAYVNCLCFLPDSNSIVLAWSDGIISVWNLTKKIQIQGFQAHKSLVSSVIDLGGNFFVTAGDDGFVKTWHISTDTCQNIYDGHTTDTNCKINTLMLLPDGWVASATRDSIQISYTPNRVAQNENSSKFCQII